MTSFVKPSLLIQTVHSEDIIPWIPFQNPLEHPDVIFIGSQDEFITIDTVRRLQSQMLQRPYQEAYVVYVLRSVDQATVEAQQALLKLLEEPPRHVQFMLMAEYPHLLLPTVLSRVVRVGERQKNDFQQNSSENVVALLDKNVADRLVWAGNFSKGEEASKTLAQLIIETTVLLEQKPSLLLVDTLKTLQQSFEFIQKRVNPKLCMEWCVLHLQ